MNSQKPHRKNGIAAKLRLPHSPEPELTFDVERSDGCRWAVVAVEEHGHASCVRCEVVSDGAPERIHSSGGISFDEPRLPRDVAYAVERELVRLWNGRPEERMALLSAGFTNKPTLFQGRSGPRRKSEAVWAARARREIRSGHPDEQALTRARDAGVLQRPPHGREFTPVGQALLDEIDAARATILRATEDMPVWVESSRGVVEAAFEDIDENRDS